jgi:hypothetical protein
LPNQGTSCLLDFVPDERGLCSIPPQPSAIVPRRFTILEQSYGVYWANLNAVTPGRSVRTARLNKRR